MSLSLTALELLDFKLLCGRLIGKIEVGKSYELSGIMVCEFRGRKFLSTSKEKSTINLVHDVGDVTTEVESEENADLTSASYV